MKYLLMAVLCLSQAVHGGQSIPRGQSGTPAVVAEAAEYWCAMHPNVRGAKGDVCRICRMPLVPAPPPDYEPFELEITTLPAAPKPGEKTQIRLLVRHPRTNARVREFDEVHERRLHLFVLSQDLDYFQHLHPVAQRDGSFLQSVTLPRPGSYRLIADFVPTGAPPQLVQQSIVTSGFAGSLIPGARLTPDVTDKVVAGVRVKLSMPIPVSGREQLLTFEFTDDRTGAPISDLEPYLGAVGHLLLIDAGLETPTHSHPVADMSAAMGPTVVFQALFPRIGDYRFWLQFQRHGQVLVAPFTVSVRPIEQAPEQ